MPDLTPLQQTIARPHPGKSCFLSGPAGAGKTTTGVQRVINLVQDGVPASEILVLVPQRGLAAPYIQTMESLDFPSSSQISVLTLGGLARRMVDLLFPMIARDAGFAHPTRPPVFLTLETTQYYMAHLVRPFLDEGLFDSITIDRNRLYSQIVDNLNKAALIGFPPTTFWEKLQAAWIGEPAQARVYADAQRCANLFRQYCLDHNLLDFSLQIELFREKLWDTLLCRELLRKSYRHLVADNLEEDTPTTHDLLAEWLPDFETALLISDDEAGYRRFLGADPLTSSLLADLCSERCTLNHSWISSPVLEAFGRQAGISLQRQQVPQPDPIDLAQLTQAVHYPATPLRFYPQMLEWVVGEVRNLIDQGLPPGEIAILAPILSDSLRFTLTNRLEAVGIPWKSQRPSRPLRDEPAARCLLTLARLAYPQWNSDPSGFEVAYALMQALAGLDLVRAHLITEVLYRKRQGRYCLMSFEQVNQEMRERITYVIGEGYERLRTWLEDIRSQPEMELDHFFSRLFGEILSQPGFGFHTHIDSGRVAAQLIESVQKFRRTVGANLAEEGKSTGIEYYQMVEDGVLAAQYLLEPELLEANAVLISPAYTFLMSNQQVDTQFWLDINSDAWAERLYQPLTHPYVLTREWNPGRVWTDADENEISKENLYRLVLGLARRCRRQVYLCYSELSEQGYEGRGLFWRTVQHVFQSASQARGGFNV
ncbi:MAG TPA: UvrD-helicase domain-containing protein [Anaerolineaceae bacterium]